MNEGIVSMDSEGRIERLDAKQFVIAVGNPFDGLTLIGPFDDGGKAVDVARLLYPRDEWYVVPLESPDANYEDHES